MIDLENFRKRAKLFLRWHSDGYYPVAAQIRSCLPRYRQLNDAEILSATFKLADAQELVARQSGYESWHALKVGVQAMTNRVAQTSSKPILTAAEPQLFVVDLVASCDFFVAKLGFAVAFTYGDPPFYGQVVRDNARLNLRCVDAPVIDRKLREAETLLSAAITLESPAGIKALFLEFQAAGASFNQTLRDEPWGSRDFIIADPDGNLLLFSGPGEPPNT